MRKNLLTEINEEARNGVIDCGIKHYLYYSTLENVNGVYDYKGVKKSFERTIIPCVRISEKEKLQEDMEEYLSLAKEFYTEFDYEGVSDVDKYTIGMLLSNMIAGDFSQLGAFFRRRTAFLKDETLSDFKNVKTIGHSDILDVDIDVEVKCEPIFMEAPYGIYINLVRRTTSRTLVFPLQIVRLGIDGEVAYIYAIQKDQSLVEPVDDLVYDMYIKKIKRKMYVIGSNLTAEQMEDKSFFNIHETSVWSVIVLCIVLGILYGKNIRKVEVPAFLINRWNTSAIFNRLETERIRNINDPVYYEYLFSLQKSWEKMNEIQKNITDKFIRTFRRVAFHFDGMSFDESNLFQAMKASLNLDNELSCNNNLLEELFAIGKNYGLRESILSRNRKQHKD